MFLTASIQSSLFPLCSLGTGFEKSKMHFAHEGHPTSEDVHLLPQFYPKLWILSKTRHKNTFVYTYIYTHIYAHTYIHIKIHHRTKNSWGWKGTLKVVYSNHLAKSKDNLKQISSEPWPTWPVIFPWMGDLPGLQAACSCVPHPQE